MKYAIDSNSPVSLCEVFFKYLMKCECKSHILDIFSWCLIIASALLRFTDSYYTFGIFFKMSGLSKQGVTCAKTYMNRDHLKKFVNQPLLQIVIDLQQISGLLRVLRSLNQ